MSWCRVRVDLFSCSNFTSQRILSIRRITDKGQKTDTARIPPVFNQYINHPLQDNKGRYEQCRRGLRGEEALRCISFSQPLAEQCRVGYSCCCCCSECERFNTQMRKHSSIMTSGCRPYNVLDSRRFVKWCGQCDRVLCCGCWEGGT